MNQIEIHKLTEKTSFNSYEDFETYPTSDIKCPTCYKAISISFKDLKKHQLSDFTNLSSTDQQDFEEFTKQSITDRPNSYLDYYCPTCMTPIRLLYESWAGGRHGEHGYDLKIILTKEKERNTGHNRVDGQ